MTPNPPARSRLITRVLTAVGALALAASAGTAAGDAVRPDAPGSGGEHFAGARIAAVEWCGTGVVGDLNSDRSEGPATARWDPEGAHGRQGPGGVAGEQHFPEPPESGISRVSVGEDVLMAEAAVSDVHFSPSCAGVPDGDDGGGSGLAGLFGADDLVVVDRAESQARWTPERGATARLEVRGLEVLGHPVEVGAGTYERTFRAEGPHGPVEVDFTARASVTELPEGRHARPERQDGTPGATTASAGLDMEFDVRTPVEEGEDPERATYRLDLAGADVHSVRGGSAPQTGRDGQDPRPSRDPEPGDDLSPGVPPSPDGGSGDPSEDPPPEDEPSDDAPSEDDPSDEGTGGSDGPDGPDGSDGPEGGAEDGQGGADDGRNGEGGQGGEGGQDGGGSPDPSASGSASEDSGSGGGTEDGASPDPSASPSPGRTPDRDDVAIDPQGSGSPGLPVTGTAILGMVATGVLSAAGGAAALYLGRPRGSSAADHR